MFNPVPSLVFKNQFGEETVAAFLAGSNWPGAVFGSLVTLSAAQVIALNATPITLVPAVAGKTVQVMAMIMAYTKGSAAFTIGASKHLIGQYHSSAVLIQQVGETGFIDGVSKQANLFGPGAGGVGIVGEAVEVTSDDSTIASGTGSTIAITTYFNLV
jgi:hypothetical protein